MMVTGHEADEALDTGSRKGTKSVRHRRRIRAAEASSAGATGAQFCEIEIG